MNHGIWTETVSTLLLDSGQLGLGSPARSPHNALGRLSSGVRRSPHTAALWGSLRVLLDKTAAFYFFYYDFFGHEWVAGIDHEQ